MNINKELTEALGMCWHEWDLQEGALLQYKCPPCRKCGKHVDSNPDFTSDAGKVQLLREMKKREDWNEFQGWCFVGTSTLDGQVDYGIPVDLILDTTGKLAKIALDWIKENTKVTR